MLWVDGKCSINQDNSQFQKCFLSTKGIFLDRSSAIKQVLTLNLYKELGHGSLGGWLCKMKSSSQLATSSDSKGCCSSTFFLHNFVALDF